MLHATTTPPGGVSFVPKVGVAPATTTMMLPAHRRPRVAKRLPVPHPSHGNGYYMPYGTIEDLKGGGLGIIDPNDAWLTGRPYGLPGTAAVKFTQRADGSGYASQMLGDAYQGQGQPIVVGNEVRWPGPYLVGGGFGDADTVALTAVVAKIADAQAGQQASLKRIAFWQTLFGVGVVVSVAASVIVGVAQYSRRER